MGKSGIYAIINKETGKYYIGSSVNIAKRIREHLWSLEKNKHFNPYLQNAFNKYGKDKFSFKVLEYVKDKDTLLDVEQDYIDKYNACDRGIGYNINEYASGGGLMGEDNPNYGKPMPEETKKKISETLMGHNVSDETRKKMSNNRRGKCLRERNWNYGRAKTKEQRKHQSEIMKGRFVGNENPFYGEKHSAETRKKISKAKAGKTGELCPNSIKIAQLTKDGKYVNEFSAMQEAQRQTGVWASNIQKCCIGELKTSGGYKWMYLEEYQALT